MTPRLIAATILVVCGCFLGGRWLGQLGARSQDERESEQRSERAKLTALGGRGAGSTASRMSKLSRSSDYTPIEKLRAGIRLAYHADVAEIPKLIEMANRESGLSSDLVLRILAERWVAEDPFGALEALIGLDPAALRGVSDIVLAGAGKADVRRAWRMVQGLDEDGKVLLEGAQTDAETRDEMMEAVLKPAAETDPELVIEMLTSLDRPGSFKETVGNILGRIAQKHPILALDALEEFPPDVFSRVDVISTAFGALSETDRESAIARLDGLRRNQRYRAAQGIAGRWADEDPVAALEWVMGLPGTVPSGDALGEIFARYSKKDGPAAAALIERIPSLHQQGNVAGWVYTTWARRDAEAAVGWARNNTLEGRARLDVYEQLLGYQRGHLEFDEQLEIANQLPDDSSASIGFAKQWAVGDPVAAANWALGRGDGARRIIREISEDWARSDLPGLEAFTTGVEDESLRRTLQFSIDEASQAEEESR